MLSRFSKPDNSGQPGGGEKCDRNPVGRPGPVLSRTDAGRDRVRRCSAAARRSRPTLPVTLTAWLRAGAVLRWPIVAGGRLGVMSLGSS
jgi:hypothetical protein